MPPKIKTQIDPENPTSTDSNLFQKKEKSLAIKHRAERKEKLENLPSITGDNLTNNSRGNRAEQVQPGKGNMAGRTSDRYCYFCTYLKLQKDLPHTAYKYIYCI